MLINPDLFTWKTEQTSDDDIVQLNEKTNQRISIDSLLLLQTVNGEIYI